jgi:hypothetical protein
LKDGELTVLQSAVTTKQSILLSDVVDIQIGIELQTIIQALSDNNLVCIKMKQLDRYINFAVIIQMSACIEEHYKKYNKDYKVIRLKVHKKNSYFDLE